jgi:hypothetical protein
MAPLPNASSKKALVDMPKALTFFMESDDIRLVKKACTYVVAHPTNHMLVAIQGRLVLADGTVTEPEISLNSLHVDLIRTIGCTRFGLKTRKVPKKHVLELIHNMAHRAKDLVGDSDDENVLLSVVCGRRDILVNRFIGLCFSETYVGRIKKSTQNKNRSDYEVGDGAKGERLYHEMMGIMNDNNAVEHKCFIQLEGDAKANANGGEGILSLGLN